MSELSDDEIDRLEAMIPKLAAVATNAAYLRAVAAGHSLIMAKDGVLVQIHPDGSEKKLRDLCSKHRVESGKTFSVGI
ncbi:MULTISPECIES: hypothetical protein [Pseudomonadaceae]|jgi:hypothetical protein|uniref:Uncharacterized protein n=8 Tax=Pseudomonas TaxID=286 RepID=A0A5M8FFW3_PSEVE|nr:MULTISPECIES: hypothetical protein [Pseudomonadaceae]ERT17870.1 hypothetical protein O162_14725 [Pseudomonas putida SJ3]MAL92063.1 hypothetical protein [Pseudomonas sp.]MBT9570243.1 hypothetical protein [Pseudomonas umsongensis]MDP9687647.1 hypothetical protein [Pseudomonas mohnii]OHC70828.1 MAG: hypothetical protein A3J25_17545 [Pseudomonadales bacterium RIFCSPLOWO2_02_FULL_63_210]|tara:strand:- start:619 stop:852 length:234 start_codon:yes stop_codon:yes gene_type:complete